MLTRDPRMIELARVRPDELDIHTLNASHIFGVAEKAVTKEQRYFAKKVEHAAQRGMHGQKMSDELLKDDIVKTPEECERLLQAYHARNPAIEGTYFPDVRKQVLRYRALANTWGRMIHWPYERLDDELYRKAYSFLPQSEVADVLNQWGLKPLFDRVKWGQCDTVRINSQVHDSLLVSLLPNDAYSVAQFLQKSLERPRVYLGNAMTIPVEWKLGSTWSCEFSWKRLPSRKEFTEAAHACEAKRGAS